MLTQLHMERIVSQLPALSVLMLGVGIDSVTDRTTTVKTGNEIPDIRHDNESETETAPVPIRLDYF